MSTPKMSINARRQYLQVQQKRYRQASRKEKSRLLDEMAAVTGLHRKYLAHLMASDLARRPRKRQRGRTYDEEVEAILLVVAESLDFICGKRLQPALLATARHLQRHGELQLSPQAEHKLAQISASSIDRLLARTETHSSASCPGSRPPPPPPWPRCRCKSSPGMSRSRDIWRWTWSGTAARAPTATSSL